MSNKTLISYYQKKQKKNKDRISDLLSGRSSITKGKKRSTPATAEASTSAAASTSSFTRRGESEMEDIIIESTSPSSTPARKRRRTQEGREEQYSEGNFSKIFKYLIKYFTMYNLFY